MAIPPPPPPGPPGPPPPPIGGLKLSPSAGAGGADPRSALLGSIQQGIKLRKTVTVDKSGPLGAGRIANANNSSSNSNNTSNPGAPSRPPLPSSASPSSAGNVAQQQPDGMPKLGGIFGELTRMPKLKPVGTRCKCAFVCVRARILSYVLVCMWACVIYPPFGLLCMSVHVHVHVECTWCGCAIQCEGHDAKDAKISLPIRFPCFIQSIHQYNSCDGLKLL